MTHPCPFPELEYEPPKSGWIVRIGGNAYTDVERKVRGLMLFEDLPMADDFAAKLGKAHPVKVATRLRNWQQCVEILKGSRIRCIHVVTETAKIRTIFVRGLAEKVAA